jgi:hypothetical protein
MVEYDDEEPNISLMYVTYINKNTLTLLILFMRERLKFDYFNY